MCQGHFVNNTKSSQIEHICGCCCQLTQANLATWTIFYNYYFFWNLIIKLVDFFLFLLKAGVDTVILTVISATSIDHFGFLEREQEDNADTHIFNIYYICL